MRKILHLYGKLLAIHAPLAVRRGHRMADSSVGELVDPEAICQRRILDLFDSGEKQNGAGFQTEASPALDRSFDWTSGRQLALDQSGQAQQAAAEQQEAGRLWRGAQDLERLRI